MQHRDKNSHISMSEYANILIQTYKAILFLCYACLVALMFVEWVCCAYAEICLYLLQGDSKSLYWKCTRQNGLYLEITHYNNSCSVRSRVEGPLMDSWWPRGCTVIPLQRCYHRVCNGLLVANFNYVFIASAGEESQFFG